MIKTTQIGPRCAISELKERRKAARPSPTNAATQDAAPAVRVARRACFLCAKRAPPPEKAAARLPTTKKSRALGKHAQRRRISRAGRACAPVAARGAFRFETTQKTKRGRSFAFTQRARRRKGEGEAAEQRFCWRAAPKGAVFLGTPQGRVHARRRAPSAACTSPSAAAQSTRRGSRRARQIEGDKLCDSNTTGEHTAFLLTILRDTERRQKPYLGRARHRRLALSPAPLHSVSPRPNPST